MVISNRLRCSHASALQLHALDHIVACLQEGLL